MRLVAFLLVGAALLGCSEKVTPRKPPANPPRVAKRAAAPYQPVALTTNWRSEVQLVSVTHEQWLRELETLRGRIVVVDNWATWCAPCVERFPSMMKMARTWSPSGVTFVTLSLDDRDDPQSLRKVREFLRKNDARIPNYLMNEINPDAFDKLGLLGIPAVFIYDQNGRLVQRLTGDDPNHQYTESDVEKAIRTLVSSEQRPSS